MSLFEFLMILLSILVGLGISELLTGFACVLRTGRISQLTTAHWALFLTLFLVLLQVFWETWSLNTLTEWSFPAMVLMLLAPVLLYLVTHMVFPDSNDSADIDLSEYYFSKSRTIYLLLILTALASVLFRPLAFGADLFVIDNLSNIPITIMLAALACSQNRLLHRLLVPLCLVAVAVDTLAISYQIMSR
jgi:hypothetical protein